MLQKCPFVFNELLVTVSMEVPPGRRRVSGGVLVDDGAGCVTVLAPSFPSWAKRLSEKKGKKQYDTGKSNAKGGHDTAGEGFTFDQDT